MVRLGELMREYEAARYPLSRQLDVQADGPQQARERVLHWIQSRAHETPGEDLLVIAARGAQPGRPPSPIEREVRSLLDQLQGRLIDWWQPFAPGSLAIRLSLDPRMLNDRQRTKLLDEDDGRTEETAGSARPDARLDIPAELLPLAERAAEMRIQREELSTRLLDVVLREIWIEAQAIAMDQRLDWTGALERIVEDEKAAYASE